MNQTISTLEALLLHIYHDRVRIPDAYRSKADYMNALQEALRGVGVFPRKNKHEGCDARDAELENATAALQEIRRAVFGNVGDEPDVYADHDRCAALDAKMKNVICTLATRIAQSTEKGFEAGYKAAQDAFQARQSGSDTEANKAAEGAVVNPGFALVPIEPTEAMHNAARDWSIRKFGKAIGFDASAGCWNSMLWAYHEPTEKEQT